MREVMGEDPTALKRDPRSATAHAPNAAGMVSAIEVRDENSLIFQLEIEARAREGARRWPIAMADRRRPQRRRAAPTSRPRHVAPTPTDVRGGGGGFEESEATIVDAGDTLLPARAAAAADGRARPDPPPAGHGVPRAGTELPSGTFDLGPDDPAADPEVAVQPP